MFSLGNRASGEYGLVQGWRRSIGGKEYPSWEVDSNAGLMLLCSGVKCPLRYGFHGRSLYLCLGGTLGVERFAL